MGTRQPVEFRGSERFAVIRRIGSGGMGAVYEALDRERGERVALKTLHRLDPRLLYRLKSEFRVLQDLHHPNLIRLGQLIEERGNWFFTMELIDGEDFLAYVRAPERQSHPTAVDVPRARRAIETAQTVDVSVAEGSGSFPATPGEPIEIGESFDTVRLRRCLDGIAEGLHALHRRGVVHCDVKPTNIMVTRTGRVVLLDFGLATDSAQSITESGPARVVGTPAYMAPELADGAKVTPSSDWYSFGVTLYQALTGRLPFRGGAVEMIASKLESRPPSPSSIARDVPEDLEHLCMALMHPEPNLRPSGAEVLARVSGAPSSEIISRTPAPMHGSFVGRTREIEMLAAAFDTVAGGRPVLMWVQARSGLGKTALVNRFLADVRQRGDTLVLSGRCYERESVPYKALDQVIDGLANYLQELPNELAALMLPRHVAALASVFPVLEQVRAVAQAPAGNKGSDPRERRSRAFVALKELLARIVDRQRVLIFIDDLQWGDVDSAALLSDLLRPPDAPGLLLIGSYRAEDAAGPVVQSMLRAACAGEDSLDVRELVLEPLSESEGRELALALVGHDRDDATQRVEAIVREAGGSPLFVGEIARHLEGTEQSDLSRSREISLETVISRRVDRLPDAPRRLLEVIAAIGRPIEQAFALRAAELDSGGDAALALLSAANLVATRAGERDTVEPYHDRIRETVSAALSPDRLGEIHARIATVIEESEWVDAELLALDLHVASGSEKAVEYVVAAALRAEKALAFERAANLYTQALDLEPEREQVSKLLRKRADVLSYAGRGAEAARDYLAVAEKVEGDAKIELIGHAADNLLRSGHIQAGLEQLEEVMRRLGIKLPRSRAGVIWSLLSKRLRLATRGLRYTPRDESEIPAADRSRIDMLYAAALSLSMIDHLRGSLVQTQHLLRALRMGEEKRVCRALGTELGYLAVQGRTKRAEALARDVVLQVDRLGDNYLIATSRIGLGTVLFFNSQLAAARDVFAEGLEALDSVVGAWWERNTVQFFYFLTLINTGDFLGYVPRVQQAIDEANRRNDAYARYLFQCHPAVWRAMYQDRVEETEQKLETVLDGWPTDNYYQANYTVMVSKVMCRLYRGDGAAARELIEESQQMIRSLMIARMPFIMGEVDKLQGRAALMEGDFATAEKMAKRLARTRMDIGLGMSAGLRASIAWHQGDHDKTERLLTNAIEHHERCSARHLMEACRFRFGQVLGGQRGDELCQRAMDWMSRQGVASPERMLAFLMPGFE